MANIVTVGRRLIPCEHIAFVEPYDPAANPRFQTAREFHGRVVLLNRDSVLVEELPQVFAEANGFNMLEADRVAANPAVHFRVETFLPAEGFTPAKAYMTRLLWRDLDGNEQSKLLLSEPETVLAVTVQGRSDTSLTRVPMTRRGRGRGNRPFMKAPVSHP